MTTTDVSEIADQINGLAALVKKHVRLVDGVCVERDGAFFAIVRHGLQLTMDATLALAKLTGLTDTTLVALVEKSRRDIGPTGLVLCDHSVQAAKLWVTFRATEFTSTALTPILKSSETVQ